MVEPVQFQKSGATAGARQPVHLRQPHLRWLFMAVRRPFMAGIHFISWRVFISC